MTRYESEKEQIRRYYEANREKIREYQKQRARKKRGTVIKPRVTREEQLARMKQWRIDNREKFTLCRDKWTREHKDRVRYAQTKYELSKQMGCLSSEVPPELVETKLAILNVTRKIKELSK